LRKKCLVKYFVEDCTGPPSWVIMAENGVLSEERANMPDPSGTCYEHLNKLSWDMFGQLSHKKFKIGLPEPKLYFEEPNPVISPS
jgi:hypothetical protein